LCGWDRQSCLGTMSHSLVSWFFCVRQFDPSSGWIWRRWKGTIFSETWPSCVKNVIYATLIFLLYKKYPGVKDHLNGFGTLWGQLLSVTTFTLTFFVNQSYALWRKCYELSRRLQGRLHDIGMNLATHATRKVPTSPDETSTYTASSRQILELMSRYIRLFDLLTYASFTRSHRPVLTPRGMRRLVERGLMTAQERQVLVDAAIPATQRHSAILMWMIRLFVEGRASGHIQGGDGFEQQTMEKFHIIRAQYGAIGDELQGRMPLAYAHAVQILVDLILWMYPIMAFSIGMSPLVAIAGTGLLTISYQGLFDLAKQFLDPYDNENYGKGEDPLSVDTLIAETNAGSVRWMYGFEEMPFSQDKVKVGELYDYLLPVRGYTVEELAQMEEEKLQREKEAEEQRIRDELERMQREEEEEEQQQQQEEERSLQTNGESEGEEVSGDLDADDTLYDDVDTPSQVEEPSVHKVFTLANGTVVSFKEESDSMVKAPEKTADMMASLSQPGLESSLVPEEEVASSGSATEMQDVDELQGFSLDEVLPLTDETPSLAQVVADGVLRNDEEVLSPSLDVEILESKILEVGTDERLQVLESMEILAVPPAYVVGESQESSIIAESAKQEEVLAVEKEALMPSTQVIPLESPTAVRSSLEGELREEAAAVDLAVASAQAKPVVKTKKSSEKKEKKTAGDKVGNAVKESSRVPEGSESGEESKSTPARMTLEDYNKQVEAIMETAKEELLETEAILNARPGYDPVGWDYENKRFAPASDVTEKALEVTEIAKEPDQDVEEEDLAVLEMDEPGNVDGIEGDERSEGARDEQLQASVRVSPIVISDEDCPVASNDELDADESDYRL
jgi:Bestrophin, RFP-TM, chloride channel